MVEKRTMHWKRKRDLVTKMNCLCVCVCVHACVRVCVCMCV